MRLVVRGCASRVYITTRSCVPLSFTKPVKQLAYICEETGDQGKFIKSMTSCIINWQSYHKHCENCIYDKLILVLKSEKIVLSTSVVS